MRAHHQAGRVFGALALIATIAATATGAAGATDDQLGDGPPPEQGQLQTSVAAAASTGPTFFFYDQYGNGVFAVYGGDDLNRYLYRSGGPIDFSIDVDRDFGPVDAEGHPTPDHPLAGKHGTLSIRAWDVDDTYDGGTIAPEIDAVTVNGTEIGTLTGADSQWSYTTIQLPLDLLRFPTPDNPTGRNDFQVHIDTGNTSEQWAVEIASVELRLTDEELPVVFNHGFGGSDNDLVDLETSFLERLPAIQGRTERTTVTRRGSIRENADLLETQIEEFLIDNGTFATNAVAHSMGGLNTRLYAFDNPGRISRFVMMGTPNGGTRIADLLCGVHRQRTWNPAILAAQSGLRRLFGDCTEGDGLYQLQQSYVQDVFNPQVPDNPATYYGTIAGKGRDIRNILLDGEDDGLVTVDSVQYLSRFDHPERGGLHQSLGVFDVNHTGLLRGQGDHATKTFCGVYPGACIPVIEPRAEALATGSPAAASSLTTEWSWTGAAAVPAGGTVDVPVEFEGAANAAVLVLADDPTALTGTVSGQPLQSGQLLDVGVLQAAITSPADGTLTLSNHTGAGVDAVVLVVIDTTRRVTVDAPAFTPPGENVPVAVTVNDPQAGDQPELRITDGAGTVVAEPTLTVDGSGRWTATYTPAEGGTYTAAVTIPGPRARTGTATFSVSPGGATIGGSYQLSTPDENGNGLHDALISDVDVTVTTPGGYRLAGKLVDRDGNMVATAGARADLAAGTTTMRLEFAGIGIFRSGLDGPFELVDVTLSDDDLQIHDHRDFPGETPAYLYRNFEHFPVEFDLGSFTDRADDIDGDGTFDQLVVDGGLRVDTTGSYALNARLVTADGTEIGRYQTTRSMAAGVNSFQLLFDWDVITDVGTDGPWVVRELTAYPLSDSDSAGFLPRAHTTAAYDLGADEVSFAGLLNALMELVETGDISHHGLIRSLEAKLDAGSAANDRGNASAAIGSLEAFRNELDAKRGALSTVAFQRLDSLAAQVLATL